MGQIWPEANRRVEKNRVATFVLYLWLLHSQNLVFSSSGMQLSTFNDCFCEFMSFILILIFILYHYLVVHYVTIITVNIFLSYMETCNVSVMINNDSYALMQCETRHFLSYNKLFILPKCTQWDTYDEVGSLMKLFCVECN